MIEKYQIEGGRENTTLVKAGVDLVNCFTYNTAPTNWNLSQQSKNRFSNLKSNKNIAVQIPTVLHLKI